MSVLVTFKGKAGRKTQERGGEANEGGRETVERRERCKSIKQSIFFRWESRNPPPFFFFFLQRLKAEKAEITRFLQKSKIQQAPKVSVGSRFKYLF